MRKATILMALVLALSVCGVGVLAAEVFDAHDQVMLTETVIYGERSKAHGLTVQANSHYQYHLAWETSLDIGEALEHETDYRFSAKEIRGNYPEEYQGLRLNNHPSGGVDFDINRAQDGLWVAYKELYDETEPGQEKERDILLKNYMEYYPISVNLDFPNAHYGAEAWESFEGMDVTPGSEGYAIQTLREYLKIPVLKDEHYGIHVRKRENGTQSGWGGGTSLYGDRYDLWEYSTLSDDACYFTFPTVTAHGKCVDISELPDGYGIYRLPYHMEYNEVRREEVSIIEADELEMVYPLTPGIEIAYLSLNASQSCLYLHTVEGGTYFVTVIDVSSMEQTQKLEVIHFEDEPYWDIRDEDDFMVIQFHNTQELAVISKAESGALKLEYICPVWPEGVNSYYSYQSAMDFDGERLAWVQPLEIAYDHEPDYRDRSSCGVVIAVYEKDGLTFLGEYKSSLDTGENWENHSFYVQGKYHEPVVAEWAD